MANWLLPGNTLQQVKIMFIEFASPTVLPIILKQFAWQTVSWPVEV